jgi:antibiotic biosynthesis monooxygenase (ABM) superfamily enzyme
MVSLEEVGMIKVLLRRRVKPGNYERTIGLVRDLRAAALHQPGYMTGETIVRGQDPIEVLVISTWLSEEHWRAWSTSEPRIELESMITPLLEDTPEAAVYRMPVEED